jgi:hypothetical protein
MKKLTPDIVFKRMERAIENIYAVASKVDWANEEIYALWLAQSFKYVQWTTRQLALASARTTPLEQDKLHWRFIEEAKEEKRHELLAANDLLALGFKESDFPELPHTSFFYQTLSYMIERESPIAILGYSLTLEGYAAKKGKSLYEPALLAHGDQATTFLKLHCEVDVDHFNNALPYLKECPEDLLPVVYRGIELCESIYKGILNDICDYHKESSKK